MFPDPESDDARQLQAFVDAYTLAYGDNIRPDQVTQIKSAAMIRCERDKTFQALQTADEDHVIGLRLAHGAACGALKRMMESIVLITPELSVINVDQPVTLKLDKPSLVEQEEFVRMCLKMEGKEPVHKPDGWDNYQPMLEHEPKSDEAVNRTTTVDDETISPDNAPPRLTLPEDKPSNPHWPKY